VHLEHRGVQEQIIQRRAVQRPGPPRLELLADHLADRDTVDFERAASAPRASVSVLSTSRTDMPCTNPAITSDSSALDLVTVEPNSFDANAAVVPAASAAGS